MKKVKMKKGITLIEIILAIVLIAIIMGLTIPKLMENSERAEIKQVITSDVRAIIEAAVMWKKSSAAAAGNYQAISANNLISRLPSSMAVRGGLIFSSGLNTGAADRLGSGENPATGVVYMIDWNLAGAAAGTALTGRFGIGMDVQNGVEDLQWNANIQAYARDVFSDLVAEISDGGNTAFNAGAVNVGTNFPCNTAATTVCFDAVRLNN